jgi:hypothetical protein
MRYARLMASVFAGFDRIAVDPEVLGANRTSSERA